MGLLSLLLKFTVYTRVIILWFLVFLGVYVGLIISSLLKGVLIYNLGI